MDFSISQIFEPANTLFKSIVGVGTIGTIMVLVAKWQISVRELLRNERRTKIRNWRQMLTDLTEQLDKLSEKDPDGAVPHNEVTALLERHKHFHSLRPHLTQKTICEIYGQWTFFVGSTIPTAFLYMSEEISQIEKQWKLV